MADTLSRDEVDALLKGMHDGDVTIVPEPAPHGVARPISLTAAQDEGPAARFPTLATVHERFARDLEKCLGAIFETAPIVERSDVVALEFTTLRNRLAPGSLMSLFTLAPLPGQGMLVVPPALGFEMVDRLFGGPGLAPPELAERPLSPIALRTVEGIALHVLAAFAGAWTPFLRIECGFVRSESNPLLVSLGGSSETVIVFETRCDLGNGATSLFVALPRGSLEPVRTRLQESKEAPPQTDRAWLAVLRDAIEHTDVVVTADLGRLEMTTRQVLAMRAGDVLHLPTRAEDALVLRVEGAPLMTGVAGVSRGRNALRVLGFEATDIDMGS